MNDFTYSILYSEEFYRYDKGIEDGYYTTGVVVYNKLDYFKFDIDQRKNFPNIEITRFKQGRQLRIENFITEIIF